MVNGRKQHFLEVYLPNLSSQRLKIPSNFIKHLTGRISGLVSLIGPSGNSWHVHLVEVTDNLYLDDGWNVFVRDHSIDYGDSLVFGYDGNMSFTVQIFDQTSCEKEEAFFANCSQEPSNVSENLANKRSEGGSAFSGASGEKRMGVCSVPTHLDLEFGASVKLETSDGEGQEHEESLRNSCDSSYVLSEPSERMLLLALPAEENNPTLLASMKEQEKKNDVFSEASHKTKTTARRKKKKVSSETSYEFGTPRRKKNDVSSETSYNFRTTPSRKINVVSFKSPYKTRTMSISKKNALVPNTTHSRIEVRTRVKRFIYKKMEENAARRFTSSFPYFVRCMTSCNAKGGVTFIPAHFSEEHMPACRSVFNLRNLNGRSWLVNVLPVKSRSFKSHVFSGGWSNFIRDNGIEEKDICIFELVAKDELRIHISRRGLRRISRGPPLKKNEVILKDDDAYPSKKSVTNDLSMPDIEEHTKVASSVDNISTLKNSTTCGRRNGKLPQCNTEDAGSPNPKRRKRDDPLSFTSPLPHFKKVLLSSSVSEEAILEIPIEFSSKHLPTKRIKIVLCNMNGKRWHMYSCPYKRRTNFVGGWSSFVWQNDLKVGDICFFELVKKWVFQVHIVRSPPRLEDCSNSSDTDVSEDDPDFDLKNDKWL